ncbi:DUF47 domain-containing protein [Mariprofundus erugo]|nr:DUF47 family protein [Mariprofundus erugo]
MEMKSWLKRLLEKVIPPMPDFYALINEQCDLCVQTMVAFVAYMEESTVENAALVRELEKRGDELKMRNNRVLDKAFTTPIDREDIYDAIIRIDEIMNYAKTTVRELEVLELKPDRHMHEMAVELRDGARALQRGFALLSGNSAEAEAEALIARKAERRVERVYRRAIAELFHPDALLQKVPAGNSEGARHRLVVGVIDILKHREIYRHMSNGADRLASASDKLNDIIVKIS